MLALRNAPARYLLLTGGLWLTVFFLSRSLLLLTHWPEANAGAGDVLRLFGIGLLYDVAFLSYALLPLGLYLALCPPRLWQRRGHQLWLQGLLGATIFVMLFSAVAEWLFWDEFGVRFNFIAVDYLVYSDEVIQNIRESYPVGSLLTLLALLSAALTWSLRKPLQAILQAPAASRSARLGSIALLAGMATAALLLLDQDSPRGQGGNTYQHELASNGPYQFFAAFRNNELDYDQFYSSLPAEAAGRQLRAELAEPGTRFLSTDPLDIRREIDNPGQPRPLNIVLVTIESLSARYLGSFGDPRQLTPNLDRLRRESLFFSNFQATGTRTPAALVGGAHSPLLGAPRPPGGRLGPESEGTWRSCR